MRVVRLSVKQLLAVLGLIASLVGLYRFWEPILSGPDPPAPMTGDLKVAVAGFDVGHGADNTADAGDGRAFGESLYRDLRRELRSLALAEKARLDIQIRGPSQVGSVRGETSTARLEAAKQIASETHADLVMYGVLNSSTRETRVEPEFYFHERYLADPQSGAPVIGAVTLPPVPRGQKLGVIRVSGDIDGLITGRARLHSRIAARARAFAAFMVGLGYYTEGLASERRGMFEAATREFQAAERTGEWDPRVGEVLYLFLGNSALVQGRYRVAREHYDHALQLEPGYPRALLGAAEVRYHLSANDCEPAVTNAAALRTNLEQYRALMRRLPPRRSVVRAKATFGLARTETCLSLAGREDLWQAAERHYRQVIAEFKAGYERIRFLAAEAYGGLGVVIHLRPATGASPRRLRVAADAYRHAIGLSRTNQLRGILFSLLGNIHGTLGELREARHDYRRAIRLDPGGAQAYRQELRSFESRETP